MAIVRRVLSAILVMLLIVTVVFVLMRSLGDPAVVLLGDNATQTQIDAFRVSHGLDRPLFEQWLTFLGGVVQGDWGDSYRYPSQGAMDMVLSRLPATLTLVVWTMVFTVIIAVPLGIISGLRPRGIVDTSSRVIAVIGNSAPIFWTAILLILIFSVRLNWFPAVGVGGWEHLVLPVASLTLYSLPLVLRMSRASIMEIMGQDFIRTARSKGISEFRLIANHGLRNASIPIITIVALRVAHLVGGTIISEQVFAYPGMGRLSIESMQYLDFPVMQAFVVVVAAAIVAINLIVDLLYQIIDPRIRVK